MSSEVQRKVVYYAKWISFVAIGCGSSLLLAALFGFFESDLTFFNALTYIAIVTSSIITLAAVVSLRYPVKAISFDRAGLYLGSQAEPIPWQDVEAVFMADVTTNLGRICKVRSQSPALCIALRSNSKYRKKNAVSRAVQGYDYYYFCELLETDGARACQDITRARRDYA